MTASTNWSVHSSTVCIGITVASTFLGRREPEIVKVGEVVALAAGANHTCALLATGSVVCWGSNSGGALGSGTEDRAMPGLVSGL